MTQLSEAKDCNNKVTSWIRMEGSAPTQAPSSTHK